MFLFQSQIGILFILSSIFNCVWLFLWQYDFIPESVIVMFALLATLIAIYLRLGVGKARVSLREKLLVHLPFSVYFGWITVATVANVAAALVYVHWDGLSHDVWALIMLIVALAVTLVVIITRRNIAYSLVIVWALAGIAVKQASNQNIITTAEIAIAVILIALAVSLVMNSLRQRRPRRSNRIGQKHVSLIKR